MKGNGKMERVKIKPGLYAEPFDHDDELNLCIEINGYDDSDVWLSREQAKKLADFIYEQLK
jgi:hypothetical protein